MLFLWILLIILPTSCYAAASDDAADSIAQNVMEATGINDAIDAIADAVGLGDDEDD